MGAWIKYLVLMALVMFSLLLSAEKTFQEVDQQSLALFNKGEWKELVKYSDQVIKEGFDYYYLRMRAGIANYNIRRFMKAAVHFKKALFFNDEDPLAGKYLFSCYLELNRSDEAQKALKDLPPSEKDELAKYLSKKHQLIVETGPLLSNEANKLKNTDLDGEQNIYGEADITGNGYYLNAGVAWQLTKNYSLYAGYSLVTINKNKQVKIADTIAVNDHYPLSQHQFYANGSIPLGKGFSVLPAVNVILDRYETVMPEFDSATFQYLYPIVKTSLNSFIGYLSVTKDFQYFKASVFGSYSNLNKLNQVQFGAGVLAFPFGNLDFYLSSKLMDHRNDGQDHLIFEQMVGIRLLKPLWTEISATFGQMKNYHENNAFVVYNIADQMNFKGEAKLIYTLNPRWTITAGYTYLSRKGEYISYSVTPPPEPPKAVSSTFRQDFQNQFILLGLKWSF